MSTSAQGDSLELGSNVLNNKMSFWTDKCKLYKYLNFI